MNGKNVEDCVEFSFFLWYIPLLILNWIFWVKCRVDDVSDHNHCREIILFTDSFILLTDSLLPKRYNLSDWRREKANMSQLDFIKWSLGSALVEFYSESTIQWIISYLIWLKVWISINQLVISSNVWDYMQTRSLEIQKSNIGINHIIWMNLIISTLKYRIH